ncbi:glycosyltransferase [Acetobacterium malicum]|uniref:4,4'-diaponeurosporenoate glycosyltransferase n=1 Tax=Acetobacterium malicum TaxID=52692 RepID=A0ABR6YZS9_9FIRM|nr:glycosyltransferase [Acetobacterium malicum]MBC3900367.1 glycosyltransferase [Acetobacterium malicum]
MIIVGAMMVLGLAASWILFYRFPGLERGDPQDRGNQIPRLSIIIPARNEEENLALLLGDLKKQAHDIHEIICVDDGSTDQTNRIATALGARLITAAPKPAGWLGKSWACQQGGEAATGTLLLFLDADVRLSPAGIGKLLKAHQKTGRVISVMPFHQIESKTESLSLFFNCIQMGANGLGLPVGRDQKKQEQKNQKRKNQKQKIHKSRHPYQIGLYGPVIMISRTDYQAVGGHAAIKGSIVDDMAMGEKLRAKDIPFALFLGDHDVSYRMYRGGLRELIQGWTKNQAAGVAKTPLLMLVLVFFWITAVASAPFYLVLNLIWQQWLGAGLMAACYGIWVLELTRIARHIGSFSVISIIFYPLLLLFYLLIFLRSLVKKILGRPVIWKDREIRLAK